MEFCALNPRGSLPGNPTCETKAEAITRTQLQHSALASLEFQAVAPALNACPNFPQHRFKYTSLVNAIAWASH